MKKLIYGFLVFMMMLGASHVQAATYQIGTYKTNKKIYVYQKASTKAKKLTSIKKSVKVSVNAVSGKYGKVTYNKKTGYIYLPYTSYVYIKGTYKANKKIYVYAKKSTKGKKLTSVAKGTSVTVTLVSGKYGKVTYNGKTGYIYLPYTALQKHLASQSSATTTSSTTSTVSSKTTIEREPGQYLIVIDPGHQKKGDSSQEPIGPYKATPTQKKVTYGTSGVKTRCAESELNLKVGLKLRTILENRGYLVVMTRTTQNVNISNIQRAMIANDYQADAFVRIHADGSTNKSLYGMHTIAPLGQSGNTYQTGTLRERSLKLSQCVLQGALKTTGAHSRGVTSHDNFSGHNWSQVPVTMIEMGYMTNANEDQLLATDSYQNKLAEGIADGIDLFFE